MAAQWSMAEFDNLVELHVCSLRLTGRLMMVTISKTVGVISSAFILCVCMSYAYAAHP